MQHLCLHTNDTTLDIWVKLGLKALFPQLFQGVKVVNDAFNSITTNSPPRWTERTDIVTCPRFFFSWILHFDAVEGSIPLWLKPDQFAYLKCNVQSVTAHFRLLNCIINRKIEGVTVAVSLKSTRLLGEKSGSNTIIASIMFAAPS